jgi:hypothetical protein
VLVNEPSLVAGKMLLTFVPYLLRRHVSDAQQQTGLSAGLSCRCANSQFSTWHRPAYLQYRIAAADKPIALLWIAYRFAARWSRAAAVVMGPLTAYLCSIRNSHTMPSKLPNSFSFSI